MPLRDDLLQPVPGDNPSGKNLRYDRVYDQIKEARTEEDDSIPARGWERQAKKADYNLVIKLAGETLATKSKDLQLAAWLGEAHIKREGAPLLSPVISLLLGLQKDFWDTLYPEIDEGDASLRTVPLQWAANRYAALVYGLPLTRSGVDFYAYKAARALGSEAAATSDAARTARAAAIKRGQITSEEVDAAIAHSPKSFYADLHAAFQEAREGLETLSLYCEEKYLDDGPSFRKLRDGVDEVDNVVNSLLAEKRKAEPDVIDSAPEPEAEAAPLPPADVPLPEAVAPAAAVPARAPAAAAPAAPAGQFGEPQSWDEASSRVHACAAYMSAQRPGSPVPYLLHTSVRWGELRKHGAVPPMDVLAAPATEHRQALKLAYAEKAWTDLLEKSMRVLSEPCARAWLDLHRYIWMATREMGYTAFSAMVVKSLQSLLADYPEMTSWPLTDDTPVANADTLAWLDEVVRVESAAPAEASSRPAPTHAPMPAVPFFSQAPPSENGSGDATAPQSGSSVFEEAAALAANGQLHAAVQMLTRDALQQPSGRMRYQRKTQIAQLCLAAGNTNVAAPILQELIAEIERRNLDSWESGDMVAKPFALLLQCMDGGIESPDRSTIFSKLCLIDPTVALEMLP